MLKSLFIPLLLLPFTLCAGNIHIETFRETEINAHAQEICKICTIVYAEYPYLYDGNADEYNYYIETYGSKPDSIVALAYDGDQVVGLATGVPLAETRTHYQIPFHELGLNVDSYYYLGELILLPEYRYQGLGTQLYSIIENYARSTQSYSLITFCQVDDYESDPQRPADYSSTDSFNEKLGFTKHPEIHFTATWTHVGETEPTDHIMRYWIKPL
jgi:GNAT superfamily N-acetyltransferase